MKLKSYIASVSGRSLRSLGISLALLSCKPVVLSPGDKPRPPDGGNWDTRNVPTAIACCAATVHPGDTAHLDGAKSYDSASRELNYRWQMIRRPAGSDAAVLERDSVSASFVPDKPGTYIAALTVHNGVKESAPDQVEITARANTAPPTANIAPMPSFVETGERVAVDGAASQDPDGDTLTYSWNLLERPNDSSAQFSNPSSSVASFITDLDGRYVVELVVNDGMSASPAAQVVITASRAVPTNQQPVADAGPDQRVDLSASARLDGSKSFDPEGQTLSYSWSIRKKPTGSNATLTSDNLAVVELLDDVVGEYVVALTVHDGTDASAAHEVRITSTTKPNAAPIAFVTLNATSVALDSAVELRGTGSVDPDGNPLTYAWSLLERPIGSAAALSRSDLGTVSVTPDQPGKYRVQLVVSDGLATSSPAYAEFTATRTNQPPVAVIAPIGAAVAVAHAVALDGAQSTDPETRALTFQWRIRTAPATSTARLTSTTTPASAITPDLEGNYVIELVVSDGELSSAPKTVSLSAAQKVFQFAWEQPLANTRTQTVRREDIAGFKFYYDVSRGLNTNSTDIGMASCTPVAGRNELTCRGSLKFRDPTKDYYVTVTVYSVGGVESGFSNEVFVSH